MIHVSSDICFILCILYDDSFVLIVCFNFSMLATLLVVTMNLQNYILAILRPVTRLAV